MLTGMDNAPTSTVDPYGALADELGRLGRRLDGIGDELRALRPTAEGPAIAWSPPGARDPGSGSPPDAPPATAPGHPARVDPAGGAGRPGDLNQLGGSGRPAAAAEHGSVGAAGLPVES